MDLRIILITYVTTNVAMEAARWDCGVLAHRHCGLRSETTYS